MVRFAHPDPDPRKLRHPRKPSKPPKSRHLENTRNAAPLEGAPGEENLRSVEPHPKPQARQQAILIVTCLSAPEHRPARAFTLEQFMQGCEAVGEQAAHRLIDQALQKLRPNAH